VFQITIYINKSGVTAHPQLVSSGSGSHNVPELKVSCKKRREREALTIREEEDAVLQSTLS